MWEKIHIKGEFHMGPTQESYTIVRYHSGTFSKQTENPKKKNTPGDVMILLTVSLCASV